jgi:hypothetical protein
MNKLLRIIIAGVMGVAVAVGGAYGGGYSSERFTQEKKSLIPWELGRYERKDIQTQNKIIGAGIGAFFGFSLGYIGMMCLTRTPEERERDRQLSEENREYHRRRFDDPMRD